MNPEVSKVIQQLADKLGVTAQYLWAVLIRGNRVEGAILSVFVVLSFGVVYVGYRFVRYALSKTAYDADHEVPSMVGGVISIAGGLGLAVGCFYWAVMGLFCPEYGALADILSHLGH